MDFTSRTDERMVEATDTIPVRAHEIIDGDRIARYVRSRLDLPHQSPIIVRQFASGVSNLTYLIQIGSWEGVLRRPPFGPIPPKAHDMRREFSLLEKIHPVFPLTPRPYFSCDDQSIMGAPFYVMERRRGVVLGESWPSGSQPDRTLCRAISRATIETLVEIHQLDWRAAGLEGFGRPQGFLRRQVEGWIGRYQASRAEDIPGVERLTQLLLDRLPASPAPALIHNDFKLNNIMLAAHDLATPVAVLDWEMSAIGDPLLDLAILLVYWARPEDPFPLQHILPTVTLHPDFMGRDELTEIYARLSGRDLLEMPYYLTFAYFKLAVVLQQIYARWLRGQTADERFASFGTHVRNLMHHAAVLTESL